MAEQHDEWAVARRYMGVELAKARLKMIDDTTGPQEEVTGELSEAVWRREISDGAEKFLVHHLTGT